MGIAGLVHALRLGTVEKELRVARCVIYSVPGRCSLIFMLLVIIRETLAKISCYVGIWASKHTWCPKICEKWRKLEIILRVSGRTGGGALEWSSSVVQRKSVLSVSK